MKPVAFFVLGMCSACGESIDGDGCENPHGDGFVHVACHCFGCVRCQPGEPDADDRVPAWEEAS